MHQQSTFLFFFILNPSSLHRPLEQNGQACRIFDFLWKCFGQLLKWSGSFLKVASASHLCTLAGQISLWHPRPDRLLRPACHSSPKEVFLLCLSSMNCIMWRVSLQTSSEKKWVSLSIHPLPSHHPSTYKTPQI